MNQFKLLSTMLTVSTLLFVSCDKDEDPIDNDDTSPIQVTDADGNIYATVLIGDQLWMAENLRTTKFSNGESIPKRVNETSDLQAHWVHYANAETNENPYGKLYNGHVVTSSQNVCPSGWHIPTDAEWTTLTDYLGGEIWAGGKMKSTGTEYWQDPNTGATNESGFSGLPGGYGENGAPFGDQFSSSFKGRVGYWWSTTPIDSEEGVDGDLRGRSLDRNHASVTRENLYDWRYYSIRCVKD